MTKNGKKTSNDVPWWAPDAQPRPVVIRKNRRARIMGSLTAVAIFALVFFTAAGNPGRAPRDLGRGAVENPPTLEAMASACTGIMSFPEPPADQVGWVEPDSTLMAWSTLPPVSGNFSPTPANRRFVDVHDPIYPSVSDGVANLYRGWMVVWYPRNAGDGRIRALQNWAMNLPANAKVLVAPWPLPPGGTWPSQRNVIYTVWGFKQSCQEFSPYLADDFMKISASNPAPGLGTPMNVTGPKAQVVTSSTLSSDNRPKPSQTTN